MKHGIGGPRVLPRCAAALLTLAVLAVAPARADIVDDMLAAGVPHTVWYSFDSALIGGNLVPNPGAWTTTPIRVGNMVINDWLGADATWPSGSVPPYVGGTIWYQRQTACSSPCTNTETSFYPLYDENHAITNGLVIGATQTNAALKLTIDGYAVRSAGVWLYRYTISNLSADARTFEFELSEFDNHLGRHDEFAFLTAGGAYAYDQPLLGPQIDRHNYDWKQLSLAAGDSLVVGFSDVHAPAPETWGLLSTGSDQGLVLGAGLPVPSVPEPGTALLALVGLLALAGLRKHNPSGQRAT